MNGNFKEMLHSGQRLYGCFLQLPSLEIAEIYSRAGFDFLIVDNEHSVMDVPFSLNMIRAIAAAGGQSLIRTPDCEETTIKKTLDTGVAGIVLPGISGLAMMREAMRFAKYAPLGNRGACPCVRANKYGERDASFYNWANHETAIIAQIEGQSALDELEPILAVEGLDGIIMGPVDLSMSLGVPGELNHPKVERALQDILAIAKAQNVATGIFCMDLEETNKWFGRGVNFVLYGIDSLFIRQHACDTVKTLKAAGR